MVLQFWDFENCPISVAPLSVGLMGILCNGSVPVTSLSQASHKILWNLDGSSPEPTVCGLHTYRFSTDWAPPRLAAYALWSYSKSHTTAHLNHDWGSQAALPWNAACAIPRWPWALDTEIPQALHWKPCPWSPSWHQTLLPLPWWVVLTVLQCTFISLANEHMSTSLEFVPHKLF